MASGETPELISQEAFQSDSKPEETTSPKEAPDQSKSSAASGSKMKNSVHEAVQHVDFAKAALPFTQISCIRNLIDKGNSVCKLFVGDSVVGTGFLLFEKYIMTNAHLFKKSNGKFKKATALFNFEEANSNYQLIEVDSIIDKDKDLDYAVLKLVEVPDDKETVYPELLKHFGCIAKEGAACIIGHPGGSVKKMDLTYIIGRDERKESVDKQVKEQNLVSCIKNDNIMKSDHVITYDTYMFGGASGSPLFDEEGRLVGMHSAGILPRGYDLSVIEYARPVLEIYDKFVENLRNKNKDNDKNKNKKNELLERISEIAKTNKVLPDPLETQKA